MKTASDIARVLPVTVHAMQVPDDLAHGGDDRLDLNKALDSFFSKLCVDGGRGEENEAVFLMTMAHLEQLAGDQILSNISSKTPEYLKSEIQSHAADEYRHARILADLAERLLKGLALGIGAKAKLDAAKKIATSFILGYFGNPYLTLSVNKHVAYVHGAMTIEMFPFQVYSVYLRKTHREFLKPVLRAVVNDEHEHIRFGQKMREGLLEAERLNLEELHRVERQMCKLLFERLSKVFAEPRSADVSANVQERFMTLLNRDARLTTAWTSALSAAEAHAADATETYFMQTSGTRPDFMRHHLEDERRHSQLLKRANALSRFKYRGDKDFIECEQTAIRAILGYQNRVFAWVMKFTSEPKLVYVLATCIIESRVFRHYTALSSTSHEILVSFVLKRILHDEKEHAQLFHGELQKMNVVSREAYLALATFEDRCFQHALASLERKWA